MELFDKIKNKLNEVSHKHLEIKVCMLGARGVGKTSVLASIFDDANSADGFSRTRIFLSAVPETRRQLNIQRKNLVEVFDLKKDIASIPPTKGVNEFHFKMGILHKDANVDMTITDYPGELIKDDPEYVSNKIKESNAVIIAIDSPFLMEENGLYDEEKNQTSVISKFIEDNTDILTDKLLIFVPLKCEKYLDLKTPEQTRNNVSEELSDKVVAKYSSLLEKLNDLNNVAVIINPILTVGGVKFDEFYLNEKGKHIAKYKFYDGKTQGGDYAKFEPRFCSQPIFHLLSFVAQQYQQHRNKAGTIGAILQNFQNVDDFFEEMVAIDNRRLKEGNGYRVIAGKHLFYSKNK